LATTLLTVTRILSDTDPNSEVDLDSETDYVPASTHVATIANGVRGVISGGTGDRAYGPGGEREVVKYKFRADPLAADIIVGDDVLTDSDGNIYTVKWARGRDALGVTFIEGECFQEIGAL
jgi:hypothetical protein